MAIHDLIRDSRVASSRMEMMARKAIDSSGAGASAVGDTFMAAAADATSSMSGMGGGTRGSQAQLKHYWGHQYTAISAIGKRLAAQQIYVASNRQKRSGGPKNSKRLMTKAVGIEGLEPLDQHELLELVNDPNPAMVRWSLMFSTAACLNLTGRAYWWLTQASGGGSNIWPIPPHWIEPADVLRTKWLVRPFGKSDPILVPGNQIAYFSLPDPSNPFGSVSPLQAQSHSITADEAIQQSQVAAFRNGIHPSVVLTAGKQPLGPGQTGEAMRPLMTREQKRQIINALQSMYRGVLNHNHPIILDAAIESITKFSLNPEEMDFLNSGKLTRGRIFQAFGVNPLIVGEIEGANRAQAVVAEESFCSNVCNPLLTMMGQVLTKWARPLFGDDLTVWFEPCRANDPEQSLKEWSVAATRGYVSPNEYRVHVLGLPPDDDPAADELPALNATLPPISPGAQIAANEIKQSLDYRRKTAPRLPAPKIDPYTLTPFDGALSPSR